jgi:hypothetical protein
VRTCPATLTCAAHLHGRLGPRPAWPGEPGDFRGGDAAESDLTPLAPAEAARRLADLTGAEVRVLDASGGRGLAAADRLAEGTADVELWNVFLALAPLCLLAEMLVAMRWRPRAVPA